MAELTAEQQKALALAAARKRQAEQSGEAATAAAPEGLKPGSREYADWAVQQAKAGRELPQVSAEPPAPAISEPNTDIAAKLYTAGGSFLEGVPVAGPTLVDWAKQGRAAVHGMTKEDVDQEFAEAKEANPVSATAGNLTGAVVSTLPLAATKAGQFAFGMTGPALQRVLLGGGSGGTLAFADALARGKDFEEAGDSALWGAGFGAAGGAAAPYIDDALGWIGRSLGLRSNVAADNLSRPSREVLQRSFGADNALGPAGMDTIRAGGPDAMLVDASPSAVGTLDAAISRTGPGSAAAREAIETRAANANTTINQALDDALGAPQGVKSTETGLRTGTAAARDAAYKQAYAQPIDYSSPAGLEIESMLTRVPEGVIGLANRLMQVEGHQSKQILAKIADDGTVTYLRQPDVTQIDYITRALNTAAKSGEGQGAMGGQTDIGRAFGNLARDLRDVTRTAVPEYDAALQTAATPIQQREALRFGESLLSPSVARDEARETVEAFTRPQLDMARQGVRSRVDEVLANVNDIVSNPNLDAREAMKALRDLSSRAARDKIRLIMDDTAASNRLFARLAQAQRALELRANVATNSRTFGRLAADEAVREATDGGAVGALMRGEPLNAGRRLVQNVTGRTPAGTRNMSDRVYSELANALTLQGDDALGMLSSLAFRSANPRAQGAFLPGLAQFGEDYGPPVMARP
ncbi:hypothetical protein PRN20_18245 [Devosia sp. ZB163]|uniref:hypothetical protein n=1 Tax=Devosia sp. ZB163 TaxID=3025938 RepID=UPI00235EBCFF|nr:hypothetical protein [Devosia sp. ZB163]MDC9825679.1 hypothetical protein [Devosia sp. ZB163]